MTGPRPVPGEAAGSVPAGPPAPSGRPHRCEEMGYVERRRDPESLEEEILAALSDEERATPRSLLRRALERTAA